ncbi:MAG: ATP-binding protein [bacterium]
MPSRRATDWTLDDIRELLQNSEQENLMLEYKSSGAVGDWSPSKRNELAKDVCAFANSAGGIIVIGVCEEGHKPSYLDDGVDTRISSKEAIESALQARISPRVENLTIKEIPNPDQPFFSYFVFGVPSSMRAPHMCNPFYRFYRRYNFESVPMEQYEVEDVRRRQTEPSLVLTASLQQVGEKINGDRLQYQLIAGVTNIGSATARDAMVRLYIPREIVGQVTWSPNTTHEQTVYNNKQMVRFDAYIRDQAGPIPIFPKDDQPYIITRGASRKITLHLPADGSMDSSEIIAHLFAEGMRKREFTMLIGKMLKNENVEKT